MLDQQIAPSIYLEPNINTPMIIRPAPGPECYCHPIDFFDFGGKSGTAMKAMTYCALEAYKIEREAKHKKSEKLTKRKSVTENGLEIFEDEYGDLWYIDHYDPDMTEPEPLFARSDSEDDEGDLDESTDRFNNG